MTLAWVIFCAFVGCVIALPFAFGSCCWLTFAGLKTTPTALWLFHAIQFAVLLSWFSNLVQCFAYLFYSCLRTSTGIPLGAVICIVAAAVLIMVNPAFYLLEDLQTVAPRRLDARAAFALRGCGRLGLLLLLSGTVWAACDLRRGGGRAQKC